MALKDLLLSSLPQYCEPLASGKNVCFRPMTVSEEKAILIAKNSGNKQTIIKTLMNVIGVCFEDITVKTLSIWDFEHMFLLLRSKSIGEIEQFKITCPETKEEVKIKINLTKDVVLKNNIKNNNKIKLSDNLLLVFKEPTIQTFLNYPNYTSSSEELYKFIGSCIKQIQNEKEIVECSELSENETTEFVQNLTSHQFKKVIEYFDTLPLLQIETKYQTSDKKEREIQIKGLFNYINFFFDYLSLQLFYQQNFEMKYNHKYSLNEIENMIPWERTVYLEQIRTELNEKRQRMNNSTTL